MKKKLFFRLFFRLFFKFYFISFFMIFSLFNMVKAQANPGAYKATGGSGLHTNRIYWVNWDLNNNNIAGDNLRNGATTTFTSPAGFTYVITLTVNEIRNDAGALVTPGSTNDVFVSASTNSYSLNNILSGYTFAPRTNAIIGMSQKIEPGIVGDGNSVNFTVSVVATDPTGNVGNATGIVVGGTETLAATGTRKEFYTLSIPATSSGRIKLIDKYISNNTWADYDIKLVSSADNKTITATRIGNGTPPDGRGDVILLAEDTPSVNAIVKGNGGQHIAIGFIEEVDFSDAPNDGSANAYGTASHLVENKFTKNPYPTGDTNLTTTSNTADLASPTGQLAKISDPTLRLGADIDADNLLVVAAGTAPTLDDTTGADDEDALPNATAGINGYYGIKYVNISSLTSYLTLWIDRDRTGGFESDEKVTITIPPNNSGTAILDVTSLNVPVGNNYYARIRYSSQNNLGPTGFAPDGEVEDHYVNVVNNIFSILGNVYYDANSGIPDGTPLNGLTVELYDATGITLLQTTTTNFAGAYIFSGLTNATYTVKVILPAIPAYQHVSSTDTTPLNGITSVVVNSANILNVNFGLFDTVCYKAPAITTGGLISPMGITSLGRGGDNGDGDTTNDWPMVRKGAWVVFESKTKGFLINRVSANVESPGGDGQVPNIASPAKGMIIYDSTNHCLKVYTGTSWKCLKTQSCPTLN